MFVTTQEHSPFYRLCSVVRKMLQKLSCINRLLKELDVFRTEYLNKKVWQGTGVCAVHARRRFPSSVCWPVVCRSEKSPSFSVCQVHMYDVAYIEAYINCPNRDSRYMPTLRYFCKIVLLLDAHCPFSTRHSSQNCGRVTSMCMELSGLCVGATLFSETCQAYACVHVFFLRKFHAARLFI